jgi:hypothetical protein
MGLSLVPLKANSSISSSPPGRRHNLPLGKLAKIIKGEDSAGMAICPVDLDRVIANLANRLRANVLSDLGRLENLGACNLIDAACAAAGTPQLDHIEVIHLAVIPDDTQLTDPALLDFNRYRISTHSILLPYKF